ncbi:hypothetical protein KEM55_002906, partial [Ascosphaera atra]
MAASACSPNTSVKSRRHGTDPNTPSIAVVTRSALVPNADTILSPRPAWSLGRPELKISGRIDGHPAPPLVLFTNEPKVRKWLEERGDEDLPGVDWRKFACVPHDPQDIGAALVDLVWP